MGDLEQEYCVPEVSESAPSSSSALRCGIRRRSIESETSTGNLTCAHLPLFRSLKMNWAKGKITSPLVQEFACGAEQLGGPGSVGMSSLASAGAHGLNPQNLQRALISKFGKPKGAPDFDFF